MRWIVRVYGLVADEWGRWLVVEEYFRGGWIQKFPGGGVEPHEGLIGALQREFWEELRVEVRRVEHFYTTDFFQRSYYHAEARLLAIYYRVWIEGEVRPMLSRQRLLWLPAAFMRLTFPVDRYVGQLLRRGEGGAVPLHSASSSAGR
ncbi:MAG: NUDIX domain-containing protein [Bacteroidia bacterium]|nr:NUDIX domain-containing protein [Bacteroidia bacterium]GIV22808.1 MAG: hypothetical protein KatS3mg025_0467 [Bacteroidia bacterium]